MRTRSRNGHLWYGGESAGMAPHLFGPFYGNWSGFLLYRLKQTCETWCHKRMDKSINHNVEFYLEDKTNQFIRLHLRRILANILSNWRREPEKGTPTLKLAGEGERVRWTTLSFFLSKIFTPWPITKPILHHCSSIMNTSFDSNYMTSTFMTSSYSLRELEFAVKLSIFGIKMIKNW